jgi:anti-anti-sigma factor
MIIPTKRRQPSRSCVSATSPRAVRRPDSFAIEVCRDLETVTVVLSGELDFRVVPALSEHLVPVLAARPRQLIFDLAQVTFADCASARLITHAGRYLPAGRGPVVKNPVPVVRRIFEVTGLADHCELTG